MKIDMLVKGSYMLYEYADVGQGSLFENKQI